LQKNLSYKKYIYFFLLIILISFITNKYFKDSSASTIQIFSDNKSYSIKCYPKEGFIKYKDKKYYLVSEKDKMIIDIEVGDIDNNDKEDILIIEGNKNSKYGDNLIIYEINFFFNEIHINEKYRNNLAPINPWTIKICDLDNDSELDIFIGAYKETTYYPGLENRPFFFNYKDNKLVKKWTGSKLRAPFKDVCFGDLDGNGTDEFIVIEEVEDGKNIVSVYYWFGFGFILQGESKIYKNIEYIKIENIDGRFLIKTNFSYLELSADKNENGIYLLKERSN